ncbi:hypothetical protein [Alienimonas sp. DA493]|uniref:hypothetical protein n=1 Tax=Alienimonas sp. DA493 TaxID=3373605 RepID=UPI003754AC6B
MASLKKYDPRLETLVMELRTRFDEECGALSPEDRRWLADRLHAAPNAAASLEYVRTPTGFARAITATRADVERLYRAAGLDAAPATGS